MHIEMTEMLRCPGEHREEFMVLATGEMIGRSVRRGTVGCPVCGREFPILEGIVDFTGYGIRDTGYDKADGAASPVSRIPSPDLQALLDLSGPGGYVLLLGRAARLAEGLAQVLEGVHFVGINPPTGTAEASYLSVLLTDAKLPLRQAFVRGAVVGWDMLGRDWIPEAVRVLLRGRRLVLEGMAQAPAPPGGVTKLAAERGLWVGTKA